MEIKGGAHHVIDPVLLHHAMHIVCERSACENGHVLASVRFGVQRHSGFLHEVAVRGVDFAEIGTLRVVIVRRWDVRVGLHARRLHVGRAGVAGAVGVAQGRVRQAEQILVLDERVAVTLGHAFHLPQDRIAAARVAGDREHVTVVGGDNDQGVVRIRHLASRLDRARELDRLPDVFSQFGAEEFDLPLDDPPPNLCSIGETAALSACISIQMQRTTSSFLLFSKTRNQRRPRAIERLVFALLLGCCALGGSERLR